MKDYSEAQYDEFLGYSGSLFAGGRYIIFCFVGSFFFFFSLFVMILFENFVLKLDK
jgi:hypothetical protein